MHLRACELRGACRIEESLWVFMGENKRESEELKSGVLLFGLCNAIFEPFRNLPSFCSAMLARLLFVGGNYLLV